MIHRAAKAADLGHSRRTKGLLDYLGGSQLSDSLSRGTTGMVRRRLGRAAVRGARLEPLQRDGEGRGDGCEIREGYRDRARPASDVKNRDVEGGTSVIL